MAITSAGYMVHEGQRYTAVHVVPNSPAPISQSGLSLASQSSPPHAARLYFCTSFPSPSQRRPHPPTPSAPASSPQPPASRPRLQRPLPRHPSRLTAPPQSHRTTQPHAPAPISPTTPYRPNSPNNNQQPIIIALDDRLDLPPPVNDRLRAPQRERESGVSTNLGAIAPTRTHSSCRICGLGCQREHKREQSRAAQLAATSQQSGAGSQQHEPAASSRSQQPPPTQPQLRAARRGTYGIKGRTLLTRRSSSRSAACRQRLRLQPSPVPCNAVQTVPTSERREWIFQLVECCLLGRTPLHRWLTSRTVAGE